MKTKLFSLALIAAMTATAHASDVFDDFEKSYDQFRGRPAVDHNSWVNLSSLRQSTQDTFFDDPARLEDAILRAINQAHGSIFDETKLQAIQVSIKADKEVYGQGLDSMAGLYMDTLKINDHFATAEFYVQSGYSNVSGVVTAGPEALTQRGYSFFLSKK
ncbi:MAG: hypothetical protein ACK5VW_01300 [Holosporales bacterium]